MASTRKERGDVAPDFTAVTIEGESIRLRGFLGRPVWLSFFRYGAAPMCSFRMHELLRDWDRFAGYEFELITVWPSPLVRLEEIRERYAPAFHVVPDPSMQIFREYGLETSVFSKEVLRSIGRSIKHGWDASPTRMPADFLIDEEGFIERAFYGRNPADQIPLNLVEDFLRGDPQTLLDDSCVSEERHRG